MERGHSIPYRSRVSSVKYQEREKLAAGSAFGDLFAEAGFFEADFGFFNFGRQTVDPCPQWSASPTRAPSPTLRLDRSLRGWTSPSGRLDGVAAQADIINRPAAIGSCQDRSQRRTHSCEEFCLTRAGDEKKKKRLDEHLQPLRDVAGQISRARKQL